MVLSDLPLRAVYRSNNDNLLRDFYIPCLSASKRYDRAVGYFSASMLSYAAQGLSAFVAREGFMRLIIGGALDDQDYVAIQEGYAQKEVNDRLGDEFIRQIQSIDDALFHRRLELLSWLIASGRLEIKIALRKQGMYHEKIGIFGDENDDQVVFQGSANETAAGLLPDFNFESINVFPSWQEALKEHAQPYLEGFEALWNNQERDTIVLAFPEAAHEKLIDIATYVSTPMSTELEIELWERLQRSQFARGQSTENVPNIPRLYRGNDFAIRPHQKRALDAWKANGFQGVLALATGAGKTVTAIYGATKIYESHKRLFLLVAVPYINLADQWIDELREFGISATRCYGGSQTWQSQFSADVQEFEAGVKSFSAAVVVNATLSTGNFQDILKRISGRALLWIGDECHHHSASKLNSSLPQQAHLRLGLSATPEHYLNTEANQRLRDFYGPVVAEYSLEDALNDGILTPYRYHIIPVELTENETERYGEISQKISTLMASGGGINEENPGSDALNQLLFQRARLLGAAQNKLIELNRLLGERETEPLTLVYCGDGSIEDQDDEPIRQIDAVTQLLHANDWRCARFTSRESRDQRLRILDQFRINAVDALVAIRCLDEGIDIPACRIAFILASSRNPKQFIQRRGRILRRAPGKEEAIIYDFVVLIPPILASGSNFERQLLRNELKRVREFAGLAVNHTEAILTLLPYLDAYDLLHDIV